MNFLQQGPIDLQRLRKVLIRAQFALNPNIYDPESTEFSVLSENISTSPSGADKSRYCLMEYLLREIEKVHAKIRRYQSPDEHPFSPIESLPCPVLPNLTFPSNSILDNIRKTNRICVNKELMSTYINEILPDLCSGLDMDDQNYGSAAMRDIDCLQALSKRIHYGIFIAEIKYQYAEQDYIKLVKDKDSQAVLDKLTDVKVEQKLLERIRKKADFYGMNYDAENDIFNSQQGESLKSASSSRAPKIASDLVVRIYKEYIIPLTKKVEVDYLFQRVDIN